MGYVDNNLIVGEQVTYRGRLHWVLFLKPALITLAVIVVAALIVYISDSKNLVSTEATGIILFVGVILASIPLLSAALTWKSAEFSVTNKRVVLKIGFIQSRTAEMFLNKIESVGVDQTILGRMLGYGDIVIRGTGGSLEPFRRVSSPLQFRNEIQEQIGRSFEPIKKH